jgi:hypothetical protein
MKVIARTLPSAKPTGLDGKVQQAVLLDLIA